MCGACHILCHAVVGTGRDFDGAGFTTLRVHNAYAAGAAYVLLLCVHYEGAFCVIRAGCVSVLVAGVHTECGNNTLGNATTAKHEGVV